MISTLLTIVIPCKNSVIELKKTINDIIKKTKIKDTRVLVLDFGSVDGSYQYAAQASNEMIRIIRIESIKMEEGETIKDAYNLVRTPYVLVMTPGSTFKDPDVFFTSVNKVSKINYSVVYLKKSDFINDLISTFLKNKRKINAIFSNKESLNILGYNPEDQNSDISLENMSKGIKVGGFTN
jgi:glycosyltransferase involved in cell wall biosynthesis